MVNQLIQNKNKSSVVKQSPPQIIPHVDTILSLEKKLMGGFAQIQNSQGMKSFESLKSEYDLLQLVLQNSPQDNSIVDVAKIKKLTNELYPKGLKLLSSVMVTQKEMSNIDIGNLEIDIAELKAEYDTCSEKLKPVVQERINKINSSLETVKGFRDKTEELLNEAGLCKDTIRELRLKLPDLMSHKPKDDFDMIRHEIDKVIGFAERVKKEYDKQGI
jgi:hypothetical protein